ncbi:MAG: amidohydrolase family protein [Eubacteriaceae bacterium]
MIIDVHTHCFPQEIAPKAMKILKEKSQLAMVYTDGTINNLKKSMIKSKVDISILQNIATKAEQTKNINRWAVKVQDEKILSFGTIHPDYNLWHEEIMYLKENKIKGIKIHPNDQGFEIDDERMYPIYEEVFKNGLIILFHMGNDLITHSDNSTAKGLKSIIRLFPNGNIIAAHMGGFRAWKEAEKYLIGEDIYIDTSSSLSYLGYKKMTQLIKDHGVNKVLFASDSPWTDQEKEISELKKLDIDNDELKLILGENARNILKIMI